MVKIKALTKEEGLNVCCEVEKLYSFLQKRTMCHFYRVTTSILQNYFVIASIKKLFYIIAYFLILSFFLLKKLELTLGPSIKYVSTF